MLSVYIFCLAVGGFFVVSSAVGGHDDGGDTDGMPDGHGHDALAHAPLKLDMRTDLAHLPVPHHAGDHVPAARHDHGDQHDSSPSTLLSFRFWTWTSCFFGLTGTALAQLTATGPWLTAALATSTGLGCGWIAARTFRWMKTHTSSSDVAREDLVGALGTVLIPIEAGRTGKVRLSRQGHTLDLLARSGEREPLAVDVQVVVIGFENDEAVVVHAGRLLGGGEVV